MLEAREDEAMVGLELALRLLDDEGGVISLTELRKADGPWMELLHLPNRLHARLEVEARRGHGGLEHPAFGVVVDQSLAREETAGFGLEYAQMMGGMPWSS